MSFDGDNIDDFFDFGMEDEGTESNDVSNSGNSNSSSSAEMQLENDMADTSKKMNSKKIGLIIIIVGFIVLLALGLGSKAANKEKEPKETKQQTSTTVEKKDINTKKYDTAEQSNTPATVYEKVTVDNGWTRITAPDIELSKQIKGTLTITEIQYFANKIDAQSSSFEIRARAVGAIDGLDGKYTLDIPWRVTDELEVGDRVAVYYYIGNIGGQVGIVDLYYEK